MIPTQNKPHQIFIEFLKILSHASQGNESMLDNSIWQDIKDKLKACCVDEENKNQVDQLAHELFLRCNKKDTAEQFIDTKLQNIIDAVQDKQLATDITSLFQFILPLCRLAYIHEKNGDPTDHAIKLAIVFQNITAATEYLLDFSKTNSADEQLLHNACLYEYFDIKSLNDREIIYWRHLASSKQTMLNPEFRSLLPDAGRLMTLAQKIDQSKKNEAIRKINWLSNNLDMQSIKEQIKLCFSDMTDEQFKMLLTLFQNNPKKPTDLLQNEIQNLSRRYKLCNAGRDKTPPADRAETLKSLRFDISLCRVLLSYYLEGTCKLDNINLLQWIAFHERLKNDCGATHKILVQQGINPGSIERFDKLIAITDHSIMPDIVLNGADIGYTDIYFRKLDVTQPEQKAIAACLGRMTNCCQYLGNNHGESCVVHGITSTQSDFYVICKGDSNSPHYNDPLLAMAWAWRSNDILVFDSIEKAMGANNEMIKDLFRYAAHQLCHGHNYAHYGIKRCHTGANSGISSTVGLKNYPASLEKLPDYRGYSDAHSQLLLADKHIPYLFINQTSSASLNNLFLNALNQLLTQIQLDRPLKENKILKKIISFAISTKNPYHISHLLKSPILKGKQSELSSLIKNAYGYLETLNLHPYKTQDKKILLTLIQQGVDIDLQNSCGQTALHHAVDGDDFKFVSKLIKLNINLDTRDQNGNTALIWALEQSLYKNKKPHARQVSEKLIVAKASLNAKDKKENSALSIAVINGDLAMVSLLVENGANIEIDDDDAKTPLYLALEKGHVDIANYLIEKGANQDVVSYKYRTPLFWQACMRYDVETLIKIFNREKFNELLLQKDGFDQTVFDWIIDCKNHTIFVPLFLLLNEQERIALYRVSIPYYNPTLLHIAVENGYTDIVKALLSSSHCTPHYFSLKNKNGYSKLTVATQRGHTDIVKVLLASTHFTEDHFWEKSPFGPSENATAFMFAAKFGYTNIVNALLNSTFCTEKYYRQEDFFGHTALITACYSGHLKTAQALLDSTYCTRSYYEQKDHSGNTALLAAAFNKGTINIIKELLSFRFCSASYFRHKNNAGYTALMAATLFGNTDAVKLLLSSKYCTYGYFNQKNKEGENALIMAARLGHIEAMKELLASSYCTANYFNEKNGKGDTALIAAARKGYFDIIELLLTSSFCTTEYVGDTNNDGNNALIAATSAGDPRSVKVLLYSSFFCEKYFAQKNTDGITALIVAAKHNSVEPTQILLASQYCTSDYFNQHDEFGRTALISAASSGRVETIKVLLNYQLCTVNYFNHQDKDGYNALLTTVIYGHTESVKELLASQYCTADYFNCRNKDGCTALIMAALCGRTETVKELLASQYCTANYFNIKHNDGNTALIAAARNGHFDVVKILLTSPFCTLEYLKQENNDGKTALSVAEPIPCMKIVYLLQDEIKLKEKKCSRTSFYKNYSLFFSLQPLILLHQINTPPRHVISTLYNQRDHIFKL